jgi:hypothetical protein
MGLTEKQKEEIKKFCSTKDITEFEISDLTEITLDHLIDEDFVDLSDDDHGDIHEKYNNLVYDFIEENL